MKKISVMITAVIMLLFCNATIAKIWKVGPTRTYTLPSQVAGLVNNNDTVDIDAGSYVDCVTWSKQNLLLRCTNGLAHVKDKSCSGKGIWITSGNNITIEHIEFSGATVPDMNGAGIRAEGGNITIRYCYFHDNEDGILAGDNPTSDILIEYCEFANNGYGDGQSHNMYINHVNNFTLRYCYTHNAIVGHEIKSRAYNNYILYNRISDESGTASRNIDIPNGGQTIIIGNLIEQGPNSQNSNMIGYGLEGFSNPGPQNIYLVNNTLVNDKSSGSFLSLQSGTALLKMTNNIFAGQGTIISGTATTLDSATNRINTNISVFGFQNAGNYDYQLKATSPLINKGSNPGFAGAFSLTPVSEYVHNSNKRNRLISSTIDIGAYEYTSATAIETRFMDQASFYVFPNPASEKIDLITEEEGNIIIVNGIGEVLVSKTISKENSLSLNIDSWPSGIYFITLHTENTIQTKKFQVIH